MKETKKVELKRVCGWCGLDLGSIHVDEHKAPKNKEMEPLVSHGICEPCCEEMVAEAEEIFAGVA